MSMAETSADSPSTELLEECFATLGAFNASNINGTRQLIKFKGRKSVEIIFNLSDKLKQSAEVKYLALEIFSRFMLRHVKEMYNHVTTVHNSSKKRLAEWNRIVARIEKQILLRAVSSIQIASKIVSHYKVITSLKLCFLLKEAGYTYNSNSVLNSELRILKALNYQVNIPCAVAYLDIFLEVLVHNEPTVNIDFLRVVSMKVLDIVSLQQEAAYTILFLNVANGNGQQNRLQFSVVENDMVYLTTVIISCSAVLINAEQSQKITHQLHQITTISKDDIDDFTRILLPFILQLEF